MITHHHTRQCALELEALPHRIGQIRRIIAAKLRYWGLDPLIDPTLLGITELLSNVHQHARPDKRCSVEMILARGQLTLSVADRDPRPPRLVPPAEPLATSGRGLAMVAAVSERWGTEPSADGDGKTVWFTLPVPPATPTAVAPAATVAAVPVPQAPATERFRRRRSPRQVAVSFA